MGNYIRYPSMKLSYRWCHEKDQLACLFKQRPGASSETYFFQNFSWLFVSSHHIHSIVEHQIFERKGQRTLWYTLTQSYLILPTSSSAAPKNISRNSFRKCLHCQNCALIVKRTHFFHSCPIGRTFLRSSFSIQLIYITWNCYFIIVWT